jgi:hypothetical protein
MQERAVGILLPMAQIGRRQLEETAMQRLVGLSRRTRSIEHFVVALVECVFRKQIVAYAQGPLWSHYCASYGKCGPPQLHEHKCRLNQ